MIKATRRMSSVTHAACVHEVMTGITRIAPDGNVILRTHCNAGDFVRLAGLPTFAQTPYFKIPILTSQKAPTLGWGTRVTGRLIPAFWLPRRGIRHVPGGSKSHRQH